MRIITHLRQTNYHSQKEPSKTKINQHLGKQRFTEQGEALETSIKQEYALWQKNQLETLGIKKCDETQNRLDNRKVIAKDHIGKLGERAHVPSSKLTVVSLLTVPSSKLMSNWL